MFWEFGLEIFSQVLFFAFRIQKPKTGTPVA